MQKSVLFGKESREKIAAGVKKITDAVRVTMGAAGKCVLVGEAIYGNDGLVHLPTIVSKDGWQVTRYFELPDAIEHRGAMMIKEAATKTVEQVGDATTCTCVLADAMISNGVALINAGANSQEIKKGMDKATEFVIAELKKMSTPVRGDIERVRQIATVSANNDKTIGDLIAGAIDKIGYDGVIDIQQSNGVETEIKVTDGFKIDRGWVSPLFVNVPAKESCEFENPYILLYDKKINHHSQVEKIMSLVQQRQRPVLVICEDLVDEGLAFLGMNAYRQLLKVCVIKSPDFGDARRDWMEDIALLTGGTYISDVRGASIKEANLTHLGSAKKVIISKTETVIVDGEGDKAKIEKFQESLKATLDNTKTEEEKFEIEKRIARLSGSIAVIKVGAATETELKEKLDRVDDSVRATKAAIAEGFIAGGGTALAKIAPKVFLTNDPLTDFQKGQQIISNALSRPLTQIVENAGLDGNPILMRVIGAKENEGYNALTGEITNMVEAGIIDSTKAIRCALQNAVSVAGMVLTSECSIVTTS